MVQAALKTWCLHYDKSAIAIYGAFRSRIGVLSYAYVFRVHLSPHEELNVILQHWESAFWKKTKAAHGGDCLGSSYGTAAEIFIFRHQVLHVGLIKT
jgi:hypothetical protein